jgi:hypothetical protein
MLDEKPVVSVALVLWVCIGRSGLAAVVAAADRMSMLMGIGLGEGTAEVAGSIEVVSMLMGTGLGEGTAEVAGSIEVVSVRKASPSEGSGSQLVGENAVAHSMQQDVGNKQEAGDIETGGIPSRWGTGIVVVLRIVALSKALEPSVRCPKIVETWLT